MLSSRKEGKHNFQWQEETGRSLGSSFRSRLALSIPASAGAASLGFEFGIGGGKGNVLLGSLHHRHHGG
jgi:hypothetical protein